MFDEFFFKNRYLLLIIFLGFILTGLGVFYLRNGGNGVSDKFEVLNATTEDQNAMFNVVVEISGEVEKPGVYKLPTDSRIEDLLITAGGLSAGADREWIEKNLNRAARLSDGQKVFIPSENQNDNTENNTQNNLINVNTADLGTLDTLPGIGPVYAQNIIEHRPYSTVQELVSKGALKSSVFEKIKDKITVF